MTSPPQSLRPSWISTPTPPKPSLTPPWATQSTKLPCCTSGPVRDAQTRRRRIVAADPEPEDDPGTLAGLARVARRVGFATAIAAALTKRRRIPRERIRQAAAASDDPIPPRLAAILKASVRTKAAELRNRHAADVADERGLVLFIRDALIGQDPPCVQVDRKYATPMWLRRHPTEHPNCTREGRPVSLPPGERVTLLR